MAKFLKLENVEKEAAKRPDIFFIPSDKERKNMKVGDPVRLHFILDNPAEDEPRAERMWVTVTRERGVFTPYKGILESSPTSIDDLKSGDEITFNACHIAQTIIKVDSPEWIDSGEFKAIVSKMCFEKGECVRFLYREQPDNDEDSGWRVFTGTETDDYVDDPDNFLFMNVGYLLNKDPSLLEPLKEDIGAVFERQEKDEPWERVTDWEPEV